MYTGKVAKIMAGQIKSETDTLQTILKDIADIRIRLEVGVFFDQSIQSYIEIMKELKTNLLKSTHDQRDDEQIFAAATDKILLEGERIIKNIRDRLTKKRIKQHFRNCLKEWAYEGTISSRALRKPQGYPGDFQTIEMFYDNQIKSTSFGALCDKYLLNQGYVQAVRDRKDHMRTILCDYLSYQKNDEIKILNLGSGSCRELRELPLDLFKKDNKVFITLLDQDNDALNFAGEQLKKRHPVVDFKFIKANVIDYARQQKHYNSIMGNQHLIYSIGLADYIPDAYLGALIKTSISMLERGGRLIIAHKNLVLHGSYASDWICDWTFIPRSKDNFLQLLEANTIDYQSKLEVDDIDQGHIFFATVYRK